MSAYHLVSDARQHQRAALMNCRYALGQAQGAIDIALTEEMENDRRNALEALREQLADALVAVRELQR